VIVEVLVALRSAAAMSSKTAEAADRGSKAMIPGQAAAARAARSLKSFPASQREGPAPAPATVLLERRIVLRHALGRQIVCALRRGSLLHP